MPNEMDTRNAMHRLEELLAQAEQIDPATGDLVQQIASGILEMHGHALQKILEHIQRFDGDGKSRLESLAADPAVSAILVLHNMHPLSAEARVRQALEKVGPYTASHGGHVEFISVDEDGVVKLRLEGSCHGCPSSRVTLQSTVEQEILAAAPEVTSIVVEGLIEEAPAPSGGFVPVENLAINGSIPLAAAAS